MRAWNAGIAVLLIGAAPSLAAPAPRLAPTDIQKTFFNGQPFTAATPKNIKYTMSFAADGKMTREPVGKPASRTPAPGSSTRPASAPRGKAPRPIASSS